MKKKVGRFLLATALVGLSFSPSQSANALTHTFDVLNFKPAVDSTRFVTLYDADTHQQGEWNVGFYLDYARHPLELGAPLGTRRVGVIDNTLIMNVLGSYGFTNWFEAGARVPVVFWNDWQGLNTVTAGNLTRAAAGNQFTMGDVALDMKFRLLDTKYVGLAIVPFVSFPTGKSTVFDGNGYVSGGGKLAVDFDPHERVKIGLNFGGVYKDNVTIRGANIDTMITMGAALSVKAHEILDVIAEGHVETVAKDFFQSEVQSPAEVGGALRFHATKNLDVSVGGTAGVTIGVGSPDFRTFLGLNYTHHKEEAPAPKPVIQAKKITIDQMIHFDFDKYNIKKDSYGILNDVASILKANPQIKRIRIEGHTDAIGTDAYNMKLSQRRANSVRDYLIQQGISADRLEAVGYGKSRPIAPNNTAAGRAQNRRVEFNVIEQ